MMASPRPLESIGLNRSERGLIIGGTGVGKSTLAEELMRVYARKYAKSRTVIIDSKPRFRAERLLDGRSAGHLYRKWDHGPTVAGSVLWEPRARDCGLESAWRLGYRTVICQTERESDRVMLMVAATVFFDQARASRPQLLYCDEMADFYTDNGYPLRDFGEWGRAPVRFARAGRERGASILAANTRPSGLPRALIQELSKLYLFRLDSDDDVKHLKDLGLRRDVAAPQVKRDFVFYNKETRTAGAYRLHRAA